MEAARTPPTIRGGEMKILLAAMLAGAAATTAALPADAAPKYFFQMQEVKAGPEVPAPLKAYAAQAVKDELAKRREWESDIGAPGKQAPGEDRSGLVAELKKRNLRGFDVTVRIENFKQELKDPRP